MNLHRVGRRRFQPLQADGVLSWFESIDSHFARLALSFFANEYEGWRCAAGNVCLPLDYGGVLVDVPADVNGFFRVGGFAFHDIEGNIVAYLEDVRYRQRGTAAVPERE